MLASICTRPTKVPIMPNAGALSPMALKIRDPSSCRWMDSSISRSSALRTTSNGWPSTHSLMPRWKKGFSTATPSRARIPLLRAVSANSKDTSISPWGSSYTLRSAVVAPVLRAEKTFCRGNFTNVAASVPPTTIKNPGRFKNRSKPDPIKMAATTTANPTTKPISVAKSMSSLPSCAVIDAAFTALIYL